MFRSSSVNALNQPLAPSMRSSSVSAAPGSAASAVAQAELKLVEAHEDLRDQFLNPSRARQDLDKHAVDSERRFPAESARALGPLLAGKIIATQTGDPGDIELSYEQFADVLGMAYESSGDFRRLFHFRVDRDPEPFCHLRSDGPCAGTLERSIDGKAFAILTLNMNAWTPCDRDARFPMYESSTAPNASKLHTLWPVRAYLDQIVPVLTGLCDEGDASHSDANREYVNLICKAAGYNEPPCTRYESPHRDIEARIAPTRAEARSLTPPSAYFEPICIITEIPGGAASPSFPAGNVAMDIDTLPHGSGSTARIAMDNRVRASDALRNAGERHFLAAGVSATLPADEPLGLSIHRTDVDERAPMPLPASTRQRLPSLAAVQQDDASLPRASNLLGLCGYQVIAPSASPPEPIDTALARRRMLSGGQVIVDPMFCGTTLSSASPPAIADDRVTSHPGPAQANAGNTSVIGMHAVGAGGPRTFVGVRVQMLDAMRATITPLLDGAGEIDAQALDQLYLQIEDALIDLRPRLGPSVRARLRGIDQNHQGVIIQASFDRLSQIQLKGLVRGQRDMVIQFQLGELAQAELNVPERALLESLAQTHRVCLAHGELDDFLMNPAVRDALLDELSQARGSETPLIHSVFAQAAGWWIELIDRRVATGHIPVQDALDRLTENSRLAVGEAFAPGLASRASLYPQQIRLLVKLVSTIADRLVSAPNGTTGFEQVRLALSRAPSDSLAGGSRKEVNFYDQALPAERTAHEIACEVTVTLTDDALVQIDKELNAREIAKERKGRALHS